MPGEPAWLVVTCENGDRRFIRLDLAVTTIGRSEGNVVDLLDTKLSRFHCEVHRKGEASYTLRDCGSRNGTGHNGRLVAAEIPLQDGDRVDIGNTLIVFHTRRPPEAGPRDNDHVQAFVPQRDGRPIVEVDANTPEDAFDPRPTLELPKSLPTDRMPVIRAEELGKKTSTKRIGRGVSTAIEGLADAPPDEVLERLATIARELVPSRQVSVILPPVSANDPPSVAAVVPKATPRFSTGVVGDVLASGEVIFVPDAKADARYQLDVSVLGLNIRGAIGIPIRVRGRTRAVLYLDDPKGEVEVLRDEALLALRSLASVAGLAASWAPGPRDVATARLDHDKASTTWVASAALAFAPVSSVDIALRIIPGMGSVVASHTLTTPSGRPEIALLFAHIPGHPDRASTLGPAVAVAFRALAGSGTMGENLLPALEAALEAEGGPIAAALVRVDPTTGAARLAGAGLGHALLRKNDGAVVALTGTGAQLGSGAGAAGIVERPLSWEPGELLLLASPPGTSDSAGAWLSSQKAVSAAAVLDAFVQSRGTTFAGACVLKRLPS